MHTNPTTTAGLLLSLAATLPHSAPLARRARRTADRLAHGASERATHAGDLLADLLTASDAGLAYPEDGCLDLDWDESP